MGSSQILLIVLSVIIVAVSMSVGIALFNQQNVSLHQKMMITKMNQLVGMALAHRYSPISIGGGGGSFVGFSPAGAVASNQPGNNSDGGVLLEDREVNYFIEWYFNDKLKIIASSKVFGEGNYWPNVYNARIEAIYDKNGILSNKGFIITGDWK